MLRYQLCHSVFAFLIQLRATVCRRRYSPGVNSSRLALSNGSLPLGSCLSRIYCLSAAKFMMARKVIISTRIVPSFGGELTRLPSSLRQTVPFFFCQES